MYCNHPSEIRAGMKNVLEFYNNLNEIMDALPLHYQLIFNVRIEEYGFIHDTGFKVILTPNHDGFGRGWDDFAEKFSEALEDAKRRWEYSASYGYH